MQSSESLAEKAAQVAVLLSHKNSPIQRNIKYGDAGDLSSNYQEHLPKNKTRAARKVRRKMQAASRKANR